MARLEVVQIPLEPVEEVKDFVLHLDRDEVEYLAKIIANTSPRQAYMDADDGIFDALRDIRHECGAVNVEFDELISNIDSGY